MTRIYFIDKVFQEWDNTASQMAQSHADNCVFQHNSYEARKYGSFDAVGQNIFATSQHNSSE